MSPPTFRASRRDCEESRRDAHHRPHAASPTPGSPVTSGLLLGALIGLRHAADPDHLAAVSSFVVRKPGVRHAVELGAAWSLGHGTTLLGVGGLAVLLSAPLPAATSILAEALVALLLIGLGLSNLRHASQPRPHARQARGTRSACLRSGVVGLAHGAAGSGLVAVAAAAAMPSPREALLYLVAVGLGTAVGMLLFSTLLSAPLRWVVRDPRRHRTLHAATGGISLAVGFWLASQLLQASGVTA